MEQSLNALYIYSPRGLYMTPDRLSFWTDFHSGLSFDPRLHEKCQHGSTISPRIEISIRSKNWNEFIPE